MAQFDVHRNSGRNREAIPFVVVVQSALYDGFRRRVVVPLVRKAQLSDLPDSALNPAFRVEGVDVVLHPLEIVSVACDQLGARIGSLGEEGNRIAAALDELLTQAWR
ncbi:MAG TPA: CcdB family protein [Rhodocyclaceae bacterium]|jgi:toxin CcdB|nr:CcdB family protein [Rhodocyclaceae bacterium]